jgi:hypothetical protein
MIPYCSLRTPIQQAKYWRQSRGSKEIKFAIDMLNSEGAFFLAKTLKDVGPQYGRNVTSALPGLSWHQWGEALDCFSLLNEKANWDGNHSDYKIYAEISQNNGLAAGFLWRRKDSVHIQNRTRRVTDYYDWRDINEIMEKRFGKDNA